MKHLILLLFTVFSCSSLFSQTWHFVGGSTGYDATEVDLEISTGGILYMAYIDPLQSNKVTVRRWDNGGWQLVGTAGVGIASVSELQLVTTADNKPAFAAKCMRTAGSTTYQSFEIYEWSGTAWVDKNVFGYAITDHSKGISLCSNSAGQLIFTFFSEDEQSNEYPEGAITVNIATQLQIGDLIVDEDNDEYLDEISTVATTATNVRHAFSYDDVGSGGTSYAYLGGGTWNKTSITVDHAEKIKIERGLGSTNYSNMWLTNNTGNKLSYRSFNGATANSALVIANSNTATDFDFDTYNDDAYVFYRNGTICYYKKLTGSVSPVSSTVTSGTALAPATATSLATERYYGIGVIAYISGGKCLVKEYNEASDIDDYGSLTMCEGAPMTNNFLLYFVDGNYDVTNNSLLVTSTNTGLVTNSAINTFANGPGYFGINITGTNDVATSTTLDIKCVLVEDGVHVDSVLIPLTINPKPNITFNFPATICENAPPLNLNNGVSPAGGTWNGPGVQGNYFFPGFTPVSSPTNASFVYSKTNNFGCSAVQPYTISIVPAPVLNVNVINADCNENNGAASLSVSEGMAPYAVQWSNGSTQNLINQIAPGPYYVSVSDANSCTVNQAVMVGSNGVAITAATTNVLCYGFQTGNIDVTVAGGSGTLIYDWSNGATTQDLQNVAAGSYELIVTDEEGCVASGSYTITQPQPLIAGDIQVNTATCGNDDGAAYITIVGGTQPFTYEWHDGDGNQLGSTGDALEDVVAGNYVSNVIDNNGCQLSTNVLISDAGGPLLAIDTVITSSCSGDGEIQIINVLGSSVDYDWSNGATTEDLTNLVPGTYILNASDGNGCLTVLSATVGSTAPQHVDICLVTVDTLTNTNLIVWEKPVTNAIDHFNIYRETSQAGVYQIAGVVPYNEESIYNDLVASPSVRSWRYKISVVDDCGTESELSAHHKTIHLTMNLGFGDDINLSWDSYEGFVFPEFVIKRHTDLDDWISLDTMPTNLFTYTDTPPTTDGLIYLITIVPPAECSSSKSAQDFNSSRSNKDNRFSTGEGSIGLQELLAGSMKLYPNPSNGMVSFENKAGVSVKAVIIDATGRKVGSFELSEGTTQKDLGYLGNGLYQVIYEYDSIRTSQKLTIHH